MNPIPAQRSMTRVRSIERRPIRAAKLTPSRRWLRSAAPGVRAIQAITRFAILIAICAVLGCKTHSPSQVVSPGVAGRVVDARTHEPIKDVKVRRESANDDRRSTEPVKGAQLMQQAPVARTETDGTFTLPCIRDLVVFRSVGWYVLSISFEHPKYGRSTAIFTPAQATNDLNGDPLIKAGDVALVPE